MAGRNPISTPQTRSERQIVDTSQKSEQQPENNHPNKIWSLKTNRHKGQH